ncbi:hypothetical protein M011DRAFT_471630 [Sporormia fimetaria CBS 119925]|uniref:Uncharacterized protein n=1 Tax=Sporormia fimetaria CBS 119925 TaxID=1340428 RepID=A0A6A6V0B1_9PLEO|nr:hypothetical protein M011DRAFT_471630 [Sporormia fimetaria CBS 119925]
MAPGRSSSINSPATSNSTPSGKHKQTDKLAPKKIKVDDAAGTKYKSLVSHLGNQLSNLWIASSEKKLLGGEFDAYEVARKLAIVLRYEREDVLALNFDFLHIIITSDPNGYSPAVVSVVSNEQPGEVKNYFTMTANRLQTTTLADFSQAVDEKVQKILSFK